MPSRDRTARRGANTPAGVDTATGHARLLPDLDRPGALLLTVDGAPQSYVDPGDPLHLEFEYVRRLAHVADAAFPPAEPLDVLHLGGGALTLARYLARTRPASGQLVVEIDEPLIAFVREHLPWDKRLRIRVRPGDARAVLESRRPASADLIVADVFAGARIPAHLTSVEYLALAAAALRPGGVYAANLADSAPLTFARGQAAAARTLFAHVALIAEPSVLRGRRFGNLVLVASDRPLPLAELLRRCAADPFPARVTADGDLDAWIGGVPAPGDADGAVSPAPPTGAFEV